MNLYAKPSLVEYGHAEDLIKGCGGWGCESGFTNASYCNTSGQCYDCYPGETGRC
jgi:hypothetical protein